MFLVTFTVFFIFFCIFCFVFDFSYLAQSYSYLENGFDLPISSLELTGNADGLIFLESSLKNAKYINEIALLYSLCFWSETLNSTYTSFLFESEFFYACLGRSKLEILLEYDIYFEHFLVEGDLSSPFDFSFYMQTIGI
uniref:Uncharacterized protein n=1 Tax=Jakoba bahamiensis TaxID=221721 RepID=M4QC73_9EUKA|nr:hypothetical protein L038_mgp02 [Jakoba bahamiensis]AGH24169.1 hypothetical protein [Jakoba bahamiensis]